MKIAVCIKQVPDTETKIKILSGGTGIDTTGIKWVMSPYDEIAVEEAIKTRDKNPGSLIYVFTVGPKGRVADVLRTALAMGADEGVLIDAPENIDSLSVAEALSAALKKEGPFDLILAGKLAIDDNAAAVPQMLAEKLNLPHVSVVSKLSVEGSRLSAEREVEGGQREIYEVSGPAVIAANKGLNIPRYASLPGIMKAKKKVLKELDCAGLGVLPDAAKVQFKDYRLPPEKPPVKMISGDIAAQAKELIRLLREEAKVI